jgi:hypothetical protein
MAKSYASDEVAMTWGEFLLTGKAPGTFVKVERNQDTFGLAVGADGEGLRYRNADKSGKITVTLMQSSAANDILSQAAAQDEISLLGAQPLMIKDATGTTLCMTASAWIVKPASVEFAAESSTREWVFETDRLEIYVGGNF